MVEVRISYGQINVNLYYRTNDDQTHFVADSKDKLYMEHRKSAPKKVIFFDTIKEMERYVQKEIAEGRE